MSPDSVTTPTETAELTSLPPGNRGLRLIGKIYRYLHERETLLWWCHSVWSFLFGIAVMVLGAKKPTYARIILFHIGFIWATSLFLPMLRRLPRLSPAWAERLRLLVNYFNKNFYQQLLFFVLPIYYASTTFPSRNAVFFAVLVLSAVLSTLDVVYDRYVSVYWYLTAIFLAFNAFVSVNVMLLVLFATRNEIALYLSTLPAAAIFVSMLYRFAGLRGQSLGMVTAGVGCFLIFVVHFSTPLIPPVMVSLGDVSFGTAVIRRTIPNPMSELPPNYHGRLAVLAPIKAPFGLTAKIRHTWYRDGRLIPSADKDSQRFRAISGGRKEGYRYWTVRTIQEGWNPKRVSVDVEMSSGQLIGRASLRSATKE